MVACHSGQHVPQEEEKGTTSRAAFPCFFPANVQCPLWYQLLKSLLQMMPVLPPDHLLLGNECAHGELEHGSRKPQRAHCRIGSLAVPLGWCNELLRPSSVANNPSWLPGGPGREGPREGGVSQSISHGNSIPSSGVDFPLFSTTNSNVKQVVTAMESRPWIQDLLSGRMRKHLAYFGLTFGIPGFWRGQWATGYPLLYSHRLFLLLLLLKGQTPEAPSGWRKPRAGGGGELSREELLFWGSCG